MAALIAGLGVITLRYCLSELFHLPVSLLLAQAIIMLVYASYSTSLAINKIYNRAPIRILAIANFLYAALSLFLFGLTFGDTSLFGKFYFLLEATFIATLATLEYRQLKYL